MKKKIQISLFSALLYLSLASCRKPEQSTNLPNPIAYNVQIQFVDYLAGIPIRNLKVKRWNNKNLPDGSIPLVYRDSLITDANGYCTFEKCEVSESIGWSSVEYFDDYQEAIYGGGIVVNNSLQFIKKEGNIFYYQAKLFPKTEVTVHIKQLTPINPDSISAYGIYLNLSSLTYDNGNARNELSFITEKNILPDCFSCSDNYSNIEIKENELLDIKIKGYLIKNLFTTLKFSVFAGGGWDEPWLIKQQILPIENRISDSQNEILITF